MQPFKKLEITHFTSQEKKSQEERVVSEVPLTILVNGKEIVTLLSTPDKLEYLAVGFLLTEGIIKDKAQIKRISLNEKGWYIHLDLEPLPELQEAFSPKRLISSGCGSSVTFYRTIDAQCPPLNSQIKIGRERIFNLMKEFQKKSSLYRETGGVHSAALCSENEIELFSEDIGRHNAVDKIFGECLLKEIPTQDKLLLTSGRITSEILLKVAKQKIPLIVSRSAPTDTAIGLADKLKVSIIGFLRGRRMNVYTHPQRIL